MSKGITAVLFFALVLLCLSAAGSIPVAGSFQPYNVIAQVENEKFSTPDGRPDDPLLAVLYKYSPAACVLVRRTEPMLEEVRFGKSVIMYAEGNARRIITVSNGPDKVIELTNRGFRKYIDGDKPILEQVNQLPLAVHELSHSYASRCAYYLLSRKLDDTTPLLYSDAGNKHYYRLAAYDAFYAGPDSTYFISRRNTNYSADFPVASSREIAPLVPEELRTFRYKTYVSSNAVHTGVSSGINGLLDEYNAYRWSLEVCYDLFGYYRDELPSNGETWTGYVRQLASYYFSWAEFRYWMLLYLDNAKKNRTALYDNLRRDERLRGAFTAIDDSFTALLTKTFDRIFREIPEMLTAKGIRVSYGPVTMIENGRMVSNLRYSYGNHSSTMMSYYFDPLLGEMNKPELTAIADDFRLRPIGKLPDMPRTNYASR